MIMLSAKPYNGALTMPYQNGYSALCLLPIFSAATFDHTQWSSRYLPRMKRAARNSLCSIGNCQCSPPLHCTQHFCRMANALATSAVTLLFATAPGRGCPRNLLSTEYVVRPHCGLAQYLSRMKQGKHSTRSSPRHLQFGTR